MQNPVTWNILKICASCTICVLSGCVGFSATGGPGKTVNPRLIASAERGTDLVRVNSILVLPVEFDGAARGSAPGSRALDQDLQEAMAQELGIQVLASSAELHRDDASHRQQAKISPAPIPVQVAPELLAQLAKNLSVDALLSVKVHQYAERVGSRIGVESPALVSFSIDLSRASDHKKLWEASYHFQDQALSENLLQIQRLRSGQGARFGWLTGDELLQRGFQAASKDLASRRAEGFLGPTHSVTSDASVSGVQKSLE